MLHGTFQLKPSGILKLLASCIALKILLQQNSEEKQVKKTRKTKNKTEFLNRSQNQILTIKSNDCNNCILCMTSSTPSQKHSSAETQRTSHIWELEGQEAIRILIMCTMQQITPVD